MPKQRPVEISLVGNLRLLADDPNVTSVRWGENEGELVLREGRYVVEVLKRRNRLLPVTVFSTLAEKMVLHGFVWLNSRLVEGDVEHVFKIENIEPDTDPRRLTTDTSSPVSTEGSPAESARPKAKFLRTRRRVSSTKLVDALDCRPWPGDQFPVSSPEVSDDELTSFPGASPEVSDDELTSFLGEARPDSGEESEMVMQLERNLHDDASGRSSFVTLASPEHDVNSDLSAFLMGKREIEQQDKMRQAGRAETHEETVPGTCLRSHADVFDINIAEFEMGSVSYVLEEDKEFEEEEELLREKMTAHRQEGRAFSPPAVHEGTEPMSDVIASIAREEEAIRGMMTSAPGAPVSLYDETSDEESSNVRLGEDMPIIIQEAGFAMAEEQDWSNTLWTETHEEKMKSSSFLTQLLTEHQNVRLGHETRHPAVPRTGAWYIEETGIVSPSQSLEEQPPTTASPTHSEVSSTPSDSTDSFVDFLGEDSQDLGTVEPGTKRRRTENKWTTVERVNLVEAPTSSSADYSQYSDRSRQRQCVNRQPAIGHVPVAAYKLVEELLENAARSRQCDEVACTVTDKSDTVAGDGGVSSEPSRLDQRFHAQKQAPHPATTSEFVPRSPSPLELPPPPPAVRRTRGSPNDDSNSEQVADVPTCTAELCAAIAELVDGITGADGCQPEPETRTDMHTPVTIVTATEQEDGFHGDQVGWDSPPDFSTLRDIWMEDWPVDHRAEHISQALDKKFAQ
ncbi:Hypp3007 [Branchiostoma lanceolatum]|uniref:Hypp3007 protein n=1 Tax=Branchiostoma lanceolatum TaxID=7740 RepID=A0A8J9ZYX4_BRALA|nr:Hypp3007 [Branchiostoma lanceolatum]